MRKSVFILFVVGLCTNQSWFVSGHNCTEPSSHECVLECIKILFDTEYCTACDKTMNITLHPNQALASLVQHNYFYNTDSSQSISAGHCSGCAIQRNETFYQILKIPADLERFSNCTTNNLTETNCTMTEIKELYEKVEMRFKEQPWCMNATDIRVQYFKYLMVYTPRNASENEMDNEDAIGNSTASSITEQITTSTEASATTRFDTSQENKEEETEKSSVETTVSNDSQSTENGVTTTTSTITVTTQATIQSTTKPSELGPEITTKPTKKKPIVEKHHYVGSLTIILVIVGILLTILIVSAVVLRVFVTRRKSMQTRRRTARSNTTSTTYIFEAHQ